MKLLFDENLSPRLPQMCEAFFPGSAHVRDCGLKGCSDNEVWEYARSNAFIIVFKDSDFYERTLFYGPPPKFVWLRIGNCARNDVGKLLLTRYSEILALAGEESGAVLVLA